MLEHAAWCCLCQVACWNADAVWGTRARGASYNLRCLLWPAGCSVRCLTWHTCSWEAYKRSTFQKSSSRARAFSKPSLSLRPTCGQLGVWLGFETFPEPLPAPCSLPQPFGNPSSRSAADRMLRLMAGSSCYAVTCARRSPGHRHFGGVGFDVRAEATPPLAWCMTCDSQSLSLKYVS